MYAGDDVSAIVIDVGTDTTRLGYAGEDQPQCLTPSKFGIIKNDGERNGELVGNEAGLNFDRTDFEIDSIVNDDGFIKNFDNYQHFLEGKLEENLQLKIDESPILFTEPSEHKKEHRLKLVEYMFEKCNVPCLFICKSAVLSSFSCGKSTCLVLDSGHNNTYAAPVHDGYILHNSTIKYKIGGKYISDKLLEHIKRCGKDVHPWYAFEKFVEDDNIRVNLKDTKGYTSSYHDFHVEKIMKLFKEECLLVSDVPLKEKKIENIKPYEYELPDGTKFEISGERCLYPEAMFGGIDVVNDELKSKGLDIEMEDESSSIKGFNGMQHLVTESINQTDLDIRKELYNNILVTGGNAMTEGFVNRLNKEVPNIAPQNLRVKIVSSHSGSLTEVCASSWVGGSILGSLGSFQQMWFSKQEYDENGAIMVERKCP